MLAMPARAATICLSVVFSLFALSGVARSQADDGLRSVDVKRFGVSVRVPQAWTLIDWAQNDKAFVLSLPQDNSSQVGVVACELGVAPESLVEFQKRHEANDAEEQKQPNPRRKLTQNDLEKLDPAVFGAEPAKQIGQRLVSAWRHSEPDGRVWYEVRIRLISHDTLYTFTLTSDEAHYQAYRLDFEEMLKQAKFSPPETGLGRLPNGFWLQREFRFALQLPEGWKAAFGPHDKVLFFATGKSHEVFTDNLLVLASAARPLDLPNLKETYPAAIAEADPRAEIAVCQIVPHAGGAALETVIHTQRGPFKISILERRFRGQKRNYEIKYTCQTDEFKRIEAELRKTLDSFRELQEAPPKTVL